MIRGGVEPPTFRFSGGRSYRLSYLTSTTARQGLTAAVLTGFEPATSTLTGWRALHAALQDHRKAIAFARMRIPPSSTWLSPAFGHATEEAADGGPWFPRPARQKPPPAGRWNASGSVQANQGKADSTQEESEIALTAELAGAPNGIRTRAAALKGRCPRPLDDGGFDGAPPSLHQSAVGD